MTIKNLNELRDEMVAVAHGEITSIII